MQSSETLPAGRQAPGERPTRERFVLAQRTGDRSHLERARPVLELLGDRQFLQRLEEVAAMLH
jgi:hypothetical protein